jgi:hypothetical protein
MGGTWARGTEVDDGVATERGPPAEFRYETDGGANAGPVTGTEAGTVTGTVAGAVDRAVDGTEALTVDPLRRDDFPLGGNRFDASCHAWTTWRLSA